MKKPILLLTPEHSRDVHGELTPQLSDVSLVSGSFGQAWQVSSTGSLAFDFTPLANDASFTLLVRMKRQSSTKGIYMGNWTEGDFYGSFLQWNEDGKILSAISDSENYDDWSSDYIGTSEFVTVTTRLNLTLVNMFEDAERRVPYALGLDNSNPKTQLSFSLLAQPNRLEIYEDMVVESIMVFNDELSLGEVTSLVNMQERWTWENTQLEEIPQQRTTASGSTRIIPSLYKVTRNNEFIEDLTPLILKGRVSFDPDRSIKWDFEAEVIDNGSIKPYVDFIAPYLTIEHEDGYKETSQFGIYTTVPPKQTITQTGRSMSLDSRDLTWLLAQAVAENGYSRAGTYNVVTTIRALLDGWGYTRHSIPDHPATFGKTTSWKAGTSRLTIINDMLNLIGYYTLYMTKDGYLASMPYISDKNKAVSVTYDTTVPSRVKVLRSITRDTTPDRIANKIVVIGGSNSDTPIVATAVNNSPSSPTSSATLGMVITKVYEGVQVSDQATADKMAQKYLDIASQEYHRMTLTTSHDLSVEPYAVYRLNIKSKTGESVATGVWNTRGWSIGFTPTEVMTHELSNIDDPAMEMGV